MDSLPEVRVFKPTRTALAAAIIWDFFAVTPGLMSLSLFHESALQRAVGAVVTLFGASSFLSTWQVMSTHIAVDAAGIVAASPNFAQRMNWDQISQVKIRSRPAGRQLGRADRLLSLHAKSRELPLLVNTSALALNEEQELLQEVRAKVCCEIEEREDGLMG